MNQPLMNQRILVRKAGGVSALELIEEAMPTPKPGEVRIRILAALATVTSCCGRASAGPLRAIR